MLDALPNLSFDKAFHWIPVLSTKTMASKTFLGSIALRPPPSLRLYFLFRGRLLSGINGSTSPQNFSETSHDLIFTAISPPSTCVFKANMAALHNISIIYG